MHVPTSALKIGDVIEDPLEYGVVTSISKNRRGIRETAVLTRRGLRAFGLTHRTLDLYSIQGYAKVAIRTRKR
jgi:hypothetical protein